MYLKNWYARLVCIGGFCQVVGFLYCCLFFLETLPAGQMHVSLCWQPICHKRGGILSTSRGTASSSIAQRFFP